MRGLTVALTGNGDPARLTGTLVSADYFDVFGVKPALGRTFLPRRGSSRARARSSCLSHAAWKARFASDPGILASQGHARRRAARGRSACCRRAASIARRSGFWKPIVFAPEQRTRDYHWFGAVGRLRRGVTVDQAREEMRAISASLVERAAGVQAQLELAVDPFDQGLVADNLRQSIFVAFGAVIMVLLIASANIANLLLAKGVDAPQGDGRSRRARRDARPPGRAVADRKPRALLPRRPCRRRPRLRDPDRAGAALDGARCRRPQSSNSIRA